jgi:hypothetical protein
VPDECHRRQSRPLGGHENLLRREFHDMTSRSESDIAQVRATASQIVLRLQNDPTFAESIRENPVSTLQAAGLPESSVNDFLHEIDSSAEVAGYIMKTVGVGHEEDECSVTCIFTYLL